MKKIIAALISLSVLPTLAIEFERSEYISEMQTGKRKRVASQAALLPEIQYKYGMFQNFLGKYIDRPLFHDRTLRPEKFAFETRESCLSELDILRNYGLTGAGNLTTSKLRAFNMMCEALSEKPEYTRNYQQYVEFSFQELLDNGKKELPQLLEASRATLKSALAYPFTGRINNKLFISTYRAGYIHNDLMRQLLEPLREEFGNTFSIMGELIVGNRDVIYFKENGHWTAEHIEKYRTKLTEILELYDGVQIQTGFRERDFKYTFNFNTDIYNQYILPLALELAAEPRFADKLFGTVMNQGYINHISGSNFGEFGTKTLRQGMDSILKLNPDFIVFFEWNEFNENTCFQPTLYNSLALQKLLKYYSLVLNGGSPLPVAPEKQLIPPLVFSHRETLKVGEELDLELLNIPDSLPGGEYSVVLQLKDIDGKIIKEFPKEEFDSTILRSITYTVATEQLVPGVIFKPEIVVSSKTGKYHNNTYCNLQYIRLLPSLCYNYKCVRQPLRDLMQPESAEFKVTRQEDGKDRITVNLKCKKKTHSRGDHRLWHGILYPGQAQ